MTSTQDTKEQVQQTASTAADEGKHVAAVVGEEAQNVAGQAKDQVRELMNETIGQVNDQSRTQLDRLVGTLKSVSTDLESMATSADTGLATQLTQQVAERARGLSTHLDGREPSDVLDDVRQFARRRPALFLLGALSAGVVVGRLARGAKQAHSQDSGLIDGHRRPGRRRPSQQRHRLERPDVGGHVGCAVVRSARHRRTDRTGRADVPRHRRRRHRACFASRR